MKIAIFHDLSSGGAKRALYELCRKLFDRGHHLDLFIPDTANESFIPLDTVVHSKQIFHIAGARPARDDRPAQWTATAWLMAERCHRHMAAQINRGGYHAAFVHQSRYPNIPALLRYLNIPSLMYCQEPNRLLYEHAVTDMGSGLRNHPIVRRIIFSIIHRRNSEEKNIQHASAVLANSYYSRESILRAYGISSHINYLGVNLNLFRPLNLPREPMILTVGAVHPSKGQRFLVESVARIDPSRRPTIVILGDRGKPGEFERLTNLANHHNVTLSIQSVDDEELVRYYNRASIVAVVPYLEPFGFTPLEAMACETPVVGIREGGVRETVVHGKTGILIDRNPQACADALDTLLKDETMRARMGRAGRQQVEANWTWDRSADQLEQIFEQIVKHHQR